MKHKLPTKKTKAALKRIVVNENGHFVDQYEVDAIFGGADQLPDGRYITVVVPDFANWLKFSTEFMPFDDVAAAPRKPQNS